MNDATQLPSLNSTRTRSRLRLRFVARCAVFFVATVSFWHFALLNPMLGALRISVGLMLRLAPQASVDPRIAIDSEGEWSVRVALATDQLQGWLSQYLPAGSRRGRATINVKIPRSSQSVLVLALPLYWAILLAAPRGAHFWRATALGTVLLAMVAILSCVVTIGCSAAPYIWDPGGWVVSVLEVAEYLTRYVMPHIAPFAVAIALLPDLRALVSPWEKENGSAVSWRGPDDAWKKGWLGHALDRRPRPFR